ncbi:MAG: FkbM family methyltransferase [Bacteroidetes bacterium]|nr:FkbM family methyltransferase [Bacteroidota bacterium]
MIKIRKFLKKEFIPNVKNLYQIWRFGSEYGGWDVAIDEINKDSIIYSFGIGDDATFDLAMIDKFDLTIHAFDPTPKSIDYVEKQNLPKNFIFHKYGIANFDGEVNFNPPENPNNISHTILDRPSTKNLAITVPVKRLSTIMTELGHQKIDVLKMDIEGAEYIVIEDLINSEIRPQQILVEIHHRFKNFGVRKTKKAIKKLKKIGYSLFSVSNSFDEFCFIYKSN